MKLEFVNEKESSIGYHIFIDGKEFKKAKQDASEFLDFAFATRCFFWWFGLECSISKFQYHKIYNNLENNSAVIISVFEQNIPRNIIPQVFVSNSNKIREIPIFDDRC